MSPVRRLTGVGKVGKRPNAPMVEVRFAHDLYGAFSVKRLFWVCCQFFVRSGKAVLRPVACDQVRGARGRGQGTETLAELGGLPPSVACVSQRLEACARGGRMNSEMGFSLRTPASDGACLRDDPRGARPPATSQLDWLSSTTAMIVLSWSKATRDLLKSFSWG